MLQNVRTLSFCKATPCAVRLKKQGMTLKYRHLIVRAEDEDILPLMNLPRKQFTAKEYERLAKPQLLGGKTIGDELELLRQQYTAAEDRASKREQSMSTGNWDGDQYIGSRWNVLSILYLVFLLTPLAGLLFAYLSYGTLWGVSDYYPPLF